jgi:hypothetical protein
MTSFGSGGAAIALAAAGMFGGGSPGRPIHSVSSTLGDCRPLSKVNMTTIRVRGYFVLIPWIGPLEIGALFDHRVPDDRAYTVYLPSGPDTEATMQVSRQGLMVFKVAVGRSASRTKIPNHTWVEIRGSVSCGVFRTELGARAEIGVTSWQPWLH